MRLLAIDPGTTRSALVGYDTEAQRVVKKAILPNFQALDRVALWSQRAWLYDLLAVEMVASYGMPVGADVFETVFWIGRFCQAWKGPYQRIFRRDVKMHLCNSARAKDANVRQALLDRFGPGKAVAVGTKKAPGPLHGVKLDLWAALAVAVTVGDREARGAA